MNNNNNNNLFKQIICNKLLCKVIFHYVNLSFKFNGKKYESLTSVEWMLNNGHYYLLKDKILKKSSLFVDCSVTSTISGTFGVETTLVSIKKGVPEYLKNVFKINDFNTFRVCFEYFQSYFQALPILEWATIHGASVEIFKYLTLERGVKVIDPEQYLLHSIRNCNVELVKYIFNKLEIKEIKIEVLEWAIKMHSIEIFNMLIDNKRCTPISREGSTQLLMVAASDGSQEIFNKIMAKYSPESSSVDLVEAALDNHLLAKSVIDEYHILCKTNWTEHRKSTLMIKLTNLVRIQRFDLVLHFVEKGIFTGDFAEKAMKLCLKYGAPPEKIFEKCNPSIYGKLELVDIKDSLDQLDIVVNYVNCGIQIGLNTIVYLCQQPKLIKVLQYVWPIFSNQDDSINTRRIVEACVKYNNFEALEFMISNTGAKHLDFIVNTHWFKIIAGHGNLAFLQYAITQNEINNHTTEHLQNSLDEAALYDRQVVYKYLFKLLKDKQILTKNGYVYEHIERLCQHGKAELIEYLVDQGSVGDSKAINTVAGTGNIGLMAYLCSIGCPFTSQALINASCNDHLENLIYLYYENKGFKRIEVKQESLIPCIKAQAFKSFKFLIDIGDFEVFNWPLSENVAKALGQSTSQIVECFFTHPRYASFKTKEFDQIIFNSAMECGNLPVIKYLYDVDQEFLNKDNFLQVVNYKYVWVMEFFKTNSLVESLKSQIIKLNAKEDLDQPDIYFTQYKKDYTSNMKSKKLFGIF